MSHSFSASGEKFHLSHRIYQTPPLTGIHGTPESFELVDTTLLHVLSAPEHVGLVENIREPLRAFRALSKSLPIFLILSYEAPIVK